MTNPSEYLKLGGKKTKVAVLFCDIRGFTSMTEIHDAEIVINLLNGIFRELTDIVFEHKGTFDKYMGDCIMVFWGAPISTGHDVDLAVRAALEMQSTFEVLKSGWSECFQGLGIGIGINYGEVIAGNLGAEHAMDYTVIGDVVNTAARIQSIAKSGQVLVTRDVIDNLEESFEFESLEKVNLKGKAKPVEMFNILKRSSGKE
jgi:adenylate cyclase